MTLPNRYFHFNVIFVLLLLINSTAQAAPPDNYQFLPLNQAISKASSENKPMFLYFGRYGCSTCRKMHQEVFTNQAVLESYTSGFVLAYVDTESGNRIRLPNGERTTEMQFAARNRIIGTPTFIYFGHDQKPVMKKAGFQTIDQMNQYSEYITKGHYKSASLKEYLSR